MLKKRIFRGALILLAIVVFGLALTPHYGLSCACPRVEKRDGNKLTYFLIEAAGFVERSLRR